MSTVVGADRSEIVKRFLFETLADVAADEHSYRWLSEDERWQELVVCLLDETLGNAIGAAEVREFVNAAGSLGLLDIGDLAVNDDTASILQRLLTRVADEPSAKTTVSVLVALCRSLVERHGGVIQRYLRQYGEAMLADLPTQLQFGSLDDDAARRVMTHWLQNALEMPISLVERSLLDVCEALGVTFPQLREIADQSGVNLALLDDVARTFFQAGVGDREE